MGGTLEDSPKIPEVIVIPAWSPDGERIVYSSERDRGYGIYVMDTNGRNSQKLTDAGSDYSPSWSPDGERITFMSYRDENSEIYTMDADGGNPQNLTNNPAEDWSPSWSPDGEAHCFLVPIGMDPVKFTRWTPMGIIRKDLQTIRCLMGCLHGPLMENVLLLYLIGAGASTSTR